MKNQTENGATLPCTTCSAWRLVEEIKPPECTPVYIWTKGAKGWYIDVAAYDPQKRIPRDTPCWGEEDEINEENDWVFVHGDIDYENGEWKFREPLVMQVYFDEPPLMWANYPSPPNV